MNNLKIGDLVKFSESGWSTMGLIVGIISECLVEVAWTGSDYVYMEDVSRLEVVNENR
jgi:hypothetical protein